jgi:hypothetical protein
MASLHELRLPDAAAAAKTALKSSGCMFTLHGGFLGVSLLVLFIRTVYFRSIAQDISVCAPPGMVD